MVVCKNKLRLKKEILLKCVIATASEQFLLGNTREISSWQGYVLINARIDPSFTFNTPSKQDVLVCVCVKIVLLKICIPDLLSNNLLLLNIFINVEFDYKCSVVIKFCPGYAVKNCIKKRSFNTWFYGMGFSCHWLFIYMYILIIVNHSPRVVITGNSICTYRVYLKWT